MEIRLDDSVLNLLEKYVADANEHTTDELKYSVESAANALLARILIQKYPI